VKQPSRRILAIDLFKGSAILAMVVLHYIYVFEYLDLVSSKLVDSTEYIVVSRFVALTFIILSMVIVWFRSTTIAPQQHWLTQLVKQTVKIGVAALIVTAVTYAVLDQSYVRFGILHMIAVATFVNGLLLRNHFPRWWFGLFGVLAVVLGVWLQLQTFPIYGWEWFGFLSPGFNSVDYVPFLPWIGVTWLALLSAPNILSFAKSMQLELEKSNRWHWLLWCGRHSLAIYLLHIPFLILLLLPCLLLGSRNLCRF
jgi:uncharacterized membrane protein